MELVQAHNIAILAARKATEDFLAKHGDRDSCGFAWVTSYEKGSTKLGRAIAKLPGFSRAYGGGYQLWNPSGSFTQAITAKEEGARAYVDTMKRYFPELKMSSGSRMD
jgi:hypothetical protein